MSESKHVTEARKVLQARFSIGVFTADYVPCEVLNVLDAAGLLRTGLEKRAIEACEAYHEACPNAWRDGGTLQQVVGRLGRESLQSRKPQPRWKAREIGVGPHWCAELVGQPGSRLYGASVSLTEQQARAIADVLNKLDAEGK